MNTDYQIVCKQPPAALQMPPWRRCARVPHDCVGSIRYPELPMMVVEKPGSRRFLPLGSGYSFIVPVNRLYDVELGLSPELYDRIARREAPIPITYSFSVGELKRDNWFGWRQRPWHEAGTDVLSCNNLNCGHLGYDLRVNLEGAVTSIPLDSPTKLGTLPFALPFDRRARLPENRQQLFSAFRDGFLWSNPWSRPDGFTNTQIRYGFAGFSDGTASKIIDNHESGLTIELLGGAHRGHNWAAHKMTSSSSAAVFDTAMANARSTSSLALLVEEPDVTMDVWAKA